MQFSRRSCRRCTWRRLKLNAIKLRGIPCARACDIPVDIFIKAHGVRKARLPSFRSQPRFLLYLIKNDLHEFRFRAAVNIVLVATVIKAA